METPPHVLTWINLTESNPKRLVIEAARDHGKCLDGDTDVLLSDGTWKQIKNISTNDMVWTRDGSKAVLSSVYSGEKEVFELKTFGGLSVIASAEHPFFTENGWEKLSDITISDRIYCPLNYAGSCRNISRNSIKLLAYLITEGSLTGSQVVITNQNEEIRNEIKKIAGLKKWCYSYHPKHYASNLAMYHGKGGAGIRKKSKQAPIGFCKRYGLWGCNSYTKRVPAEIFRCSPKAKALFLNRAWACDGWITKNQLGITFANEHLIDDFQRLLLGLGIFSCKIYRGTPVNNKIYSLHIQDALNQNKFLHAIGSVFTKEKQCQKLRKRLNKIKPSNTRGTKHQILNSWLGVKSIINLGVKKTYDIMIKDCHEFSANGLIVHNSWYFSYGNPLYHINRINGVGEAPIFIALGSYSEEQAKKNLKRIREAVEDKPALQWLLPKKKSATWDVGELNFSNGCVALAFGVGSSVRGGHFHKIIFDDPSKDHWTISLEQQKNFLFGVVMPALRRDGQIIICGTPVALQDLLWVLEEGGKFPLFKFPALDENNRPLWPEHYTYDDLMERRDLIGSYLFAREYLLKRMTAADARFKSEWIKYYVAKPEGAYFRIMTIDPTLEGADAMGIVITDTSQKMKTYVIHSGAYKGTVQEAVETIFRLYEMHKPDIFGIETFVFQKMMKLWLEMEQEKRGVHFPIIELEKEGVRKTYKARIMSLQPRVEAGQILFREHKDDELVDQMLNWDIESKHNTDDLLVALAHQVPLLDRPCEQEAPRQEIAGTFNEAFADLIKSAPQSDFEGIWSDFFNSQKNT